MTNTPPRPLIAKDTEAFDYSEIELRILASIKDAGTRLHSYTFAGAHTCRWSSKLRAGYVLDTKGTYWPNDAWYAHCLFERRHPRTWGLEVRMLNKAVAGGIAFG